MASIAEITKDLEAAIKDANSTKLAFESAQRAVSAAEQAYFAAVAAVKDLNGKYKNFIDEVVAAHTQVHK